MSSNIEQFSVSSLDPAVRGFLHRPDRPNHEGLVFTHGAGGNAQSPMLIALAEAFAGAGFAVLRCNLPFRQSRAFGPPRPSDSERDRRGLKNAVEEMRKLVTSRVFLGGQSYGGRQATILCAAEPKLADGLLLTSYPLHPPGKPQQLRVEHFPELRTPALFVEGTRDPFGTPEEMEQARKLIPARTMIVQIDGGGHDLGFRGKTRPDIFPRVIAEFQKVFGSS
jgi:hypothetical protein